MVGGAARWAHNIVHHLTHLVEHIVRRAARLAPVIINGHTIYLALLVVKDRTIVAAQTVCPLTAECRAGSILYECVSSTAGRSIAETEQYFVVESSMARSTSAGSIASP